MNCKKNNNGFSLIELIVTIAIMAIALGASVSIYGLIRSSKLSSMSENLGSAIGDLRTTTLAKADKYRLKITKSGDDYVAILQKGEDITGGGVTITKWSDFEKTKISDYGLVYFVNDTDGAKCEIGTGTNDYYIIISVNRGDKSFGEISGYRATSNDMSIELGLATPIDIKDNEITTEYSDRKKVVKLIEITGKYYIK